MPDAIPDRLELKYVVPVERLDALRDDLAATCVLDRHAEAAPGHRYLVTSLYFDGPGLPFFRAKQDRAPRRLKPRVRRYGVAGPVLFEVKRKLGDVIRKTRAPVPEDWPSWLEQPPAEAPHAVHDFVPVIGRSRARPVLLVRYEREAWVSVLDAYARVTFDTRLCFQPVEEPSLCADEAAWLFADDPVSLGEAGSFAVVELKCTRAVPGWMERLVRRHGLLRRGFSKYCAGIERVLGARGVNPAARVPRFGA